MRCLCKTPTGRWQLMQSSSPNSLFSSETCKQIGSLSCLLLKCTRRTRELVGVVQRNQQEALLKSGGRAPSCQRSLCCFSFSHAAGESLSAASNTQTARSSRTGSDADVCFLISAELRCQHLGRGPHVMWRRVRFDGAPWPER